jgi:hypothetical protein
LTQALTVGDCPNGLCFSKRDQYPQLKGAIMATLFDREWSKAELLRHVGHMDQLAGVRLMELVDVSWPNNPSIPF